MKYYELSTAQKLKISTLGELKNAGYQARSIKDELRSNLIQAKRAGKNLFDGIWGYEDTVIPDVERAILSRHNINFLGLRGQAKTRMARMMTQLLDEYIPVVEGAPLNDDPLNPISKFARDKVEEHGDQTPIGWKQKKNWIFLGKNIMMPGIIAWHIRLGQASRL